MQCTRHISSEQVFDARLGSVILENYLASPYRRTKVRVYLSQVNSLLIHLYTLIRPLIATRRRKIIYNEDGSRGIDFFHGPSFDDDDEHMTNVPQTKPCGSKFNGFVHSHWLSTVAFRSHSRCIPADWHVSSDSATATLRSSTLHAHTLIRNIPWPSSTTWASIGSSPTHRISPDDTSLFFNAELQTTKGTTMKEKKYTRPLDVMFSNVVLL